MYVNITGKGATKAIKFIRKLRISQKCSRQLFQLINIQNCIPNDYARYKSVSQADSQLDRYAPRDESSEVTKTSDEKHNTMGLEISSRLPTE